MSAHNSINEIRISDHRRIKPVKSAPGSKSAPRIGSRIGNPVGICEMMLVFVSFWFFFPIFHYFHFCDFFVKFIRKIFPEIFPKIRKGVPYAFLPFLAFLHFFSFPASHMKQMDILAIFRHSGEKYPNVTFSRMPYG